MYKNNQKGQSLIEFALVFPIFVTLLFFAIEMSLFIRDQQSVSMLTGEIARQVFIGKSDAFINSNVTDLTQGVGLKPVSLNITINPDSSSRKSGDLTTIQLSYPHEFMFDFLNVTKMFGANPYLIDSETKTVVQ